MGVERMGVRGLELGRRRRETGGEDLREVRD